MERLGAIVAVALLTPSALVAQAGPCEFRGAPDALDERSSPLDSLEIRLGSGEAKLCYGRPSAYGRAMVGVEHPYGSPWQMGDNEPTTLHLGFSARVGVLIYEWEHTRLVIPITRL